MASRRGVALRIAAVAYIVVVYAVLYRLYPSAFRLTAPLPLVAAAALLLTAAEVVRGVRLALLYRSVGGSTTLRGGVEARFAGNIVALLTPSVAGGEVVRGLVLHGAVESRAAPAIGVAAVDGGLDLIGNYTLALLAAALHSAPAAPLPELLAAAPFAAWVAGLLLVTSGWFARIASRIAARLEGRRLLGRISSWVAELEKLHIPPRVALTALAATFAAWGLQVASYWLLSGCAPTYSAGCVAELLLMGVIPTPGGVGPGEALLAPLCPGIASWRIVYIAASTLPGVPVFLAGLR